MLALAVANSACAGAKMSQRVGTAHAEEQHRGGPPAHEDASHARSGPGLAGADQHCRVGERTRDLTALDRGGVDE